MRATIYLLVKVLLQATGIAPWYVTEKVKHDVEETKLDVLKPKQIIHNNKVEYRLNDKLHREDGPAVEFADGTKEWWINGKQLTKEEFKKRSQQPKKVVYKYRVEYQLNGKLHREDGPAIECENGDKFWYLNGKYHREDGPAIEFASGSKFWYKNDKPLTEEEFNKQTS